jgi:hypothetical protein
MNPADRTDYLASVPASARGIVGRAFAGKAAPRGAIKAMCLTCSNFERDEIADCAVILCPLHSYRPFQSDRKTAKTARGSESCAGSAASGGTT